MDFSSSFYLPNSEKRLEHLQEVINGRPVAILAAGPSINELENRISELNKADICYFGMNTFTVQENHILQKINKQFSLVLAGANRGLPQVMPSIIDFLNRAKDNLFVSSFYESQFELFGTDFDLQGFLQKHDSKLLFPYGSKNKNVPNNHYPLHFLSGNSLAWLVYLAVIGKASKIVLFGADGYTKGVPQEKTYYRANEYGAEPQKALVRDTYAFFNPVVPISLKNIYRTYNVKPIEILNCSENSYYTPFPTVSYDHALAWLNGQKDYDPSWDTRPNPIVRLKRGLVSYQLPQARKIIIQWIRYGVKLTLPRPLFLVMHRQLQYCRRFYHQIVRKN